MTTIGAVIRNMMPSGTNPGGDDPDWSTCPEWPPDLFGVTATLIERTGLYSHAWLYAHQSAHASMASSEKSSIRAAGRGWRVESALASGSFAVPPLVVHAIFAVVSLWAMMTNDGGAKKKKAY